MDKEYLNDDGEVVMPMPKYRCNQSVLVIRDGRIELRQIDDVVYRVSYKNPVFYKVSCIEGFLSENEVFGTPQEMCDAILATFKKNEFGVLSGDWSKKHWGVS